MRSNFMNDGIRGFLYRISKIILRLRGCVFELVHRRGLKQVLNKTVPKNIQSIFLENHLKKLLDFPITFSIEITNICNAKCWFCPTHKSEREKGYMDFLLFKKIIDEIKPRSKTVKSIALFMDGEPTLHKGLFGFFKYSAKIGIKRMYISSNMEYFTPELTDKIFKADLGRTFQYIICSVDGTNEETYSKNRIGCNFNRSVYNIEYLIRQRSMKRKLYPRIFTRLLVSKLTKNEVDKFKGFWRGKSDKVLCYNMHNWGGAVLDDNLNIDYNDNFIPCYFPFSQFAIQYDGTVRLCCVDANSSTIIGNVNYQSITEIWNNQIINKIRESHLKRKINVLPEICKNCSYPKKGSWIAPFFWNN